MKNLAQFPLQFRMTNTPLYWAILSFLLIGLMVLIQILGGNLYKEFYAFIGLVIMLSYCGIKFLFERFNQTLFIDEEKITSKKIIGGERRIFLKDINSVSLDESPPRFVIKGNNETINVSLKFKNWEVLLNILEDKVPDNKFDF